MRKIFYAVSLLLALSLGFLVGRREIRREPSAKTTRQALYYVDPMHPSYRSDKPGIAPDCGMPLEPVYADEAGKAVLANKESVPDTVAVDAVAQQLFGIRVAKVQKTAGTRTIRALGRVTADETRAYRVYASLDGFVEESHNDTIGSRVKKGQRLATVYSLEFYSMIGGYVAASEQVQIAAEQTGGKLDPRKSLEIQSWQNRLRNLGMSPEQIEELYVTHKVPEGIYMVAPIDGFIIARNISPGMRFERNSEFYRIADLSRVWIVADLFDGEDQYFRPGALARVSLQNENKNGKFSARVSDILPQVNPATRAVSVRFEAENPSYALRPDMYVNVDYAVPAPKGLSIPADAVIDSGLAQRVYVQRGNGTYERRQVKVGERFGDRVQILTGLVEGESVVASGTFLVDSESRLKSAPDRTWTGSTGNTRDTPRAALPADLSRQAQVVAGAHNDRAR